MSEENKDFENDEEISVTETSDRADDAEKVNKTPRKISLSTFICSAVAILVAAVMLTYTVCNSFYKKEIAKSKIDGAQNVTIDVDGKYDALETLERFFKQNSFEKIDDEKQLTAVMKAYVAATGDRYAEYYTQEEYAKQMSDIAGQSVGIGVNVINDFIEINGVEYNTIKVINVFKGSPAESSDLKVGDRIAWVGEGDAAEYVGDIGYNAAVNKIRGEAGTDAKFTVLRQGENGEYFTKEISVTRAAYEVESVSEKKIDGTSVGYVKIDGFDIATPNQFSASMDSLIEQNCDSFVFDVRNNSGGDLKSIVAILSYFLEEGDTIITMETVHGAKTVHKAEPSNYIGAYEPCSISKSDIGKYRGYKITVLCNENTASAAELFTATFRDYKLATVIGTKTFGKGVAQSLVSLSSLGIDGYLKYTSSLYYPPCGENYDGAGISPDVVEELSEEAAKYNPYDRPVDKDNQLQKALECLNK